MKLTREFPSNYAMAQWQPSDHKDAQVIGELFAHFGAERFTIQNTRTGVPCRWFPNANWYMNGNLDLFGITFDGHPPLRRIMMPQNLERSPAA